MSMITEFREFMKEYKITGLAVAFILGGAVNSLVKSLTEDLIMPLVNPFLQGGSWQTAALSLGPFTFQIGHFASQLLNFAILALIVFMIFGKLLRNS